MLKISGSLVAEQTCLWHEQQRGTARAGERKYYCKYSIPFSFYFKAARGTDSYIEVVDWKRSGEKKAQRSRKAVCSGLILKLAPGKAERTGYFSTRDQN